MRSLRGHGHQVLSLEECMTGECELNIGPGKVQEGKGDNTGLGKPLKCPSLKGHRQETTLGARKPWERPMRHQELKGPRLQPPFTRGSVLAQLDCWMSQTRTQVLTARGLRKNYRQAKGTLGTCLHTTGGDPHSPKSSPSVHRLQEGRQRLEATPPPPPPARSKLSSGKDEDG